MTNLGCGGVSVAGYDSLTRAWFGLGAFSTSFMGYGGYYSTNLHD